MTRFEADRLDDVLAAIDAIHAHLARGDLSDDLVLDAIRARLIEIGEAVKALSDTLTLSEPAIPWRQIARMRDHLAHRYFVTSREIIASTVNNDLDELAQAVRRLKDRLDAPSDE